MIKIEHLNKYYNKGKSNEIHVINDSNLELPNIGLITFLGESGSGKSVTSKAILGILANNKIVEDGQIIYDGKDLLKLNEEQFTKIRGVKISMIFQDPLSSLNPIMKVGKQLTEAMYLKAKATRKEAFKYLIYIGMSLATLSACFPPLISLRSSFPFLFN